MLNERCHKVLLVDPNSYKKRDLIMPLSFLYLDPILKEAGFDVKILHNFNKKDLFKALNKDNFLFAGVTVNTSKSLLSALEISKIVKKFEIPVVWGGPHATMLPNLTLQNPYVDIVVIGEGERTIVELANNMGNLPKVKGIGYKNGRKITINKPREFIKDLDKLPLPSWDMVKKFPTSTFYGDKKYATIETSRGCPYGCGFCFKQFGNIWRYKNVKRLLEEVEYLQSLGISCVDFVDDMFLLSKKRVVDFCKQIIKEKIDLHWRVRGARVDQVDMEILYWMKKAGCEAIAFGVESGSQRILNLINKGIKIKQIEECFHLCHKFNIIGVAFLMTDFPTETKKDLDQTIKLIHKIQPALCVFSYYTPFPRTRLYPMAIKHGFKEPKSIEGWAKVDMRFNFYNLSEIDPFTLMKTAKWTYYNYYLRPLLKERIKKDFWRGCSLTLKDFLNSAFLSLRS